MATAEGSLAPSAQVVGNAFVEQYYHILHQSPGLVHRFYQDSSLLSRPDSNGAMTSVTTMQVSILELKMKMLTDFLTYYIHFSGNSGLPLFGI